MIGQLIGGFIVIFIAFSLLGGTMKEEIAKAFAEGNTTLTVGSITIPSTTIFDLILLFFVLGIVGIAIGVISRALRSVGLFGSKEDDSSEDDEESEEDYMDCEYCEREILEDDGRVCNECENDICIYCREIFGEYNYCKGCYRKVRIETEDRNKKYEKMIQKGAVIDAETVKKDIPLPESTITEEEIIRSEFD